MWYVMSTNETVLDTSHTYCQATIRCWWQMLYKYLSVHITTNCLYFSSDYGLNIANAIDLSI